jgi:hypothetical protein
MIKKLSLLLFAILLVFLIENCGSCDDCQVSPAAKQVSIVNSKGENLLFGANAVYDPKDIEIKNNLGDLVDFLPNDNNGSIDFSFNLNFDTYFIKLTNTDTDTLSFTFGKDRHIDCCNEFDVTKTTSVNGKTVINDDKISIVK